MRPSLTAVAVAVAVTLLSAGCSAPNSPAAPTIASSPSAALTASVATTATTASASHAVPFKGRLDGTYSLTFPNASTLAVTGKGTGNGTHLGQFTFAYDEIVNLSTGVGTGTYELTGANGDTVTAHWTGFGFPTDDPNVLGIVENATITGGTGRFANASGSFKVERLFNFVTSSGGGSFDGTILLH